MAYTYHAWEEWATTSATTTGTFDYWCDSTNTATSTWTEWHGTDLRQRKPSRQSLEQRNQNRIRAIEDQDRRKAAIERARELLVASLTPEQREQYDANMEFIVFGQKTGRRYLIKDGRVGNVHELDKADGLWPFPHRARRQYCAHPSMMVPNADTMLAQKLMLECNEQDFLDLANVS